MLADLIISRNRALIEAVELTDLEKEEALFEGKKKKYFREKNAEHWSKQEQKKGKTEVTKISMKTYEEIMANLFEYHFKNVSPNHVDIKKEAAKEYAKQWVVTAVALAGIDRTVEKNESTVRLIQSKIDAQ